MNPVTEDQIDGTMQTHLSVSAKSVARAWRSLVVEATVRPGQTVVLQGTGAVSLAALAFAKMLRHHHLLIRR